jgi:hypothetical protein
MAGVDCTNKLYKLYNQTAATLSSDVQAFSSYFQTE